MALKNQKSPLESGLKTRKVERMSFDLSQYGITVGNVYRNPSPAQLYEDAIIFEKASITSAGALRSISGEKTGRSPKDKRVVDNPESTNDIWWGSVNIKMPDSAFLQNRSRAIDYLNTRDHLYVIDAFAGWDPENRIKVRIICARAYHALFMTNMLICPTAEELADFGAPDFVVFNAGQFKADPTTESLTSPTSVNLSFERGEFVILGTEYAGEMKKGVFTIMNYLMPKKGYLSMHCSANEGKDGDTCLFFGLSGTGKTTLSTEPNRKLIGDDEHYWTDKGVVNIEGGCYAKCIHLSAESEPEIYNAIKFGTVLENTEYFPGTREVDFDNDNLTENTRASYPINYIENIKEGGQGGHPKNIVLLTCDAFGVLPPVSKLTPEQAMYYFISGYTSKVAGTEVGIKEPQPTFSACFGAAFLVWHPTKYAELLAANMAKYGSNVWLVNTGWSGGAYGVGKRLSIKVTRAIVDAIHNGSLNEAEYQTDEIFGLSVPKSCPNVPAEVLLPENSWADKASYRETAQKLAKSFHENFKTFEDQASEAVRNAGPKYNG